MNTTEIYNLNESDRYYQRGNATLQYGSGTYLDAMVAWKIGTGIVCSEFVLALILNVTVIILILQRRRGRCDKMSFFALHLAISDFMMAIFFIFPPMIDRLADVWLGGLVLCKIMKYLSLAVCYASTYILVVLSGDRLFAVVTPLPAIRTGVWYRRILIAIAWFLGAVFAIPDGVFATIVNINDKYFCELLYPPEYNEHILLTFATLNVFIPAILITICYTWIVLVIWKRGRIGFRVSSEPIYAGINKNTRRPKHESNIITRAKIKSVKLTFVVVTVFLLCWSPMTLCMILNLYGFVQTGPYFFILMALAPLNSVANPCVFLIFNFKTFSICRRVNRSMTNGIALSSTPTKYKGSPYLESEMVSLSASRRSLTTTAQ